MEKVYYLTESKYSEFINLTFKQHFNEVLIGNFYSPIKLHYNGKIGYIKQHITAV